MGESRRIVFYTKPGCSLCAKARPAIDAIAERRGLTVAPFDIETGPEEVRLHQRYRIPVLEFRGEELGWGRIDPDDIERRLDAILARGDDGGARG